MYNHRTSTLEWSRAEGMSNVYLAIKKGSYLFSQNDVSLRSPIMAFLVVRF